MRTYVLIFRNDRGAVVQRFEFASPSDSEAQRIAESEAKGRDVELWSGTRRISSIAAEAQSRRLQAIRRRFAKPVPVPRNAAVIATTAAGTVAYWDENAAALYGWRPREAVGRDIVELTPAVQSRIIAAEIMDSLQAGRAWAGEIVLRHRDGSPFRAFVLDVPLGGLECDEGAIVGVSMPVEQANEILAMRRTIEEALAHRFSA